MGGGSGEGAVTEGSESNKDEGVEAVTVNVRCSNGTKFSVQVALESSVESFKSVLEQSCEIPAGQQRLIYKGRILKDNQTLKSYGLEAEHTVHLVRGFVPGASTPAGGAPTTASTPPPVAGGVGSVEGGPVGGIGLGASPFPGLGLNGLGGNGGMFGGGLPELEQMQQQLTQNPNMMREIMDLPLVQNLLNNPDVMRNMMMNNPQMRDIIDRNPELAHMLNDPAILRQTMEAARNPELMREMMRNTDRAMSNIESSPEGFNMLRRMYENVQEPFLNATTMGGGGGGDTRNDMNSNPFAALLGAQGGAPRGQVPNPNPTTTGADTTGSPAPNTNPLPNPWAAGGGGGGNQTNATATGRSPPIGGLGGLGGVQGLEGLFGAGGTAPDPNSMSQLMQNPAVSQMMQSLLSNPQYMNQVLGMNPQMRGMLESNPQLREMMQNPDFIRQLTSPETMQQMMQLQQSLFSGRPPPTGQTGGAPGGPENMGLDMLMNMFGGLGTGTGGFTMPNTSNVPPEELYATQLAQLQEMGFFDTRENLQALTATAGNVHAAVERLLGNLGQ